MKPVVPLPPLPQSVVVDGGSFVGDVGDSGFKWPPLASYSNVHEELMQQEKKKGLVCGSCEETCNSSSYEYTKDGCLILCEKCFKSGNYEKNMSADDFKLNHSVNQASVWTEAETLLLLESMVKHRDDWDLVAKNVGVKSQLDCISKLIQLPFGNLVAGAADKKNKFLDIVNDDSHSKQSRLASEELQESVKAENLSNELKDNERQNGDAENEGPAPKRLRTELTSDYGSSLMKQVARISTVVGPHITASVAEAAVSALVMQTSVQEKYLMIMMILLTQTHLPELSKKRVISTLTEHLRLIISVEGGRNNQSAQEGASQDEISDDLKSIMEKEGSRIQELKESLVLEWLKLLQKIFSAGINKTKEPSSVKYRCDTVP